MNQRERKRSFTFIYNFRLTVPCQAAQCEYSAAYYYWSAKEGET